MAKTLQYAKYAAVAALLLMLPTVFYPQEGLAGLAVNFIYFGAGIVVYTGFMHIGKTENSRLMRLTAQTIIAIICIFAFLSILQNTPYRMTIGKEAAALLTLLNIIYGLAIIGLGVSLPRLEKRLGKTAAFAAVTYAITGIFYTLGWAMSAALLTMQTLPPEMNGNLITALLRTALVVSIFAQAATIAFFHAAEKKLH